MLTQERPKGMPKMVIKEDPRRRQCQAQGTAIPKAPGQRVWVRVSDACESLGRRHRQLAKIWNW